MQAGEVEANQQNRMLRPIRLPPLSNPDSNQVFSKVDWFCASLVAVQVKLNYHVRVLVPCYKEDLDIIQKTVLAALDATLPAGCARTVYLCDDGKDPEKREWIG